MKKALRCVILFVCVYSARAQINYPEQTHGTINILLANKNGLVLLTDSRLSNATQQPAGEGQKLFVLDDHTICSIAGFYSDNGPNIGNRHPVATVVPGIIGVFLKEKNPAESSGGLHLGEVASKLNRLAAIYKFALDRVETLNQINGMTQRPSSVILTIAGYQGSELHVEGLSLIPSLTGDKWSYVQSDPYSEQVKNTLVKRITGVTTVADDIFEQPQKYSSSAVLSYFAKEIDKNDGQDLTIKDLNQVADQIEFLTSAKFRNVVGGERQIAILRNGHVEPVNVMQLPLDTQLLAAGIVYMDHADITGNASFLNGLTGNIMSNIIMNSVFRSTTLHLDGGAYSNNSFANCNLTYDDLGPVLFTRNNLVENSTLILGSKVLIDDPFVTQIVKDYPQLIVQYSK
jgi:hypothetical protein